MKNLTPDLSFFPDPSGIRASVLSAVPAFRDRLIREAAAQQAGTSLLNSGDPALLDTVGTTRSNEKLWWLKRKNPGLQILPNGLKSHLGGQGLAGWEKEHSRREKVRAQISELQRLAGTRLDHGSSWILNKASATLSGCGKLHLVEKLGPANYRPIQSYHCKRKYCPRCAEKKRNILLARFYDFFDADADHVKELQRNYDLAIMTVTLRHGPHTPRQGWYYKELRDHWANSLKYGAFKKYLAGGVYTTEITYSEKNGYHIHRHALCLIPKKFGFRENSLGKLGCGLWLETENGWDFQWRDSKVRDQLRDAWIKKTGDSFQVDIKPLNGSKPFLKNILEVFKYVAKPSSENGKMVVPAQICEQLDINCRQKFINRFGLLYREKSLALNEKKKEEGAERLLPAPENIFFATGIYKTTAGNWAFRKLWNYPGAQNMQDLLAAFRTFVYRDRQSVILTLQNAAFRRENNYEDKNKIPWQLRRSDAPFSAAGVGGDPVRAAGRSCWYDQKCSEAVDGLQASFKF